MRGCFVIHGVDGRVHHNEMDAARAEEVGRGMIVAASSAPPGPSAAGHNIMDVAGSEGVPYSAWKGAADTILVACNPVKKHGPWVDAQLVIVTCRLERLKSKPLRPLSSANIRWRCVFGGATGPPIKRS